MKKNNFLVLVEGPTDRLVLENPLNAYIEETRLPYRLFFQVVNGDLTSKGALAKAGSGHTLEYIHREIKRFLSISKLKITDLAGILEINDLDACFAPITSYKYADFVDEQHYEAKDEIIWLEDPSGLAALRAAKAKNLLFLKEQKRISYGKKKLGYAIFYFSINLEGAFYDELNLKSGLKRTKARHFEAYYGEKGSEFLSFLRTINGNSTYEESWDEEKRRREAFKRDSNLSFFFTKIEEVIKK